MSEHSGGNFAETVYGVMSDEELQNTLRCEMFSAGAPDSKQIEMILAEMERRDINSPPRSPEEAWNEFEKSYSGQESCYIEHAPPSSPCPEMVPAALPRHRHRLKHKTIVLAAVISVILSSILTVQAVGVDVLGSISRWTAELFSLGTMEDQKRQGDNETWIASIPEEGESFDSLQEALDTYGITEVVAPKWIPNTFSKVTARIENANHGVSISATYGNESGEYIIIEYIYNSSFNYYEKVDVPPSEYECSGQVYSIIENSKEFLVVWKTEHFECYISAPVDSDTLYRIIRSLR